MLINSITNHTHTSWGMPYTAINWLPEWYTFVKLQNKEIKQRDFNERKDVAYIVYWFDTNILQKIGIDKLKTLRVRLRIICGMINKLPYTYISRPMKMAFMECIWDTYKKFNREYYEYYYKYIIGLPF